MNKQEQIKQRLSELKRQRSQAKSCYARQKQAEWAGSSKRGLSEKWAARLKEINTEIAGLEFHREVDVTVNSNVGNGLRAKVSFDVGGSYKASMQQIVQLVEIGVPLRDKVILSVIRSLAEKIIELEADNKKLWESLKHCEPKIHRDGL